ncbi:response regulator [Pontibacter sp. JAM-7]|uniref:response regulator n=1 Tax=Pontibacter sp. JAM-7 TaxID=3366581 RepID=UPI003AF71E4E
MKVLLVDDNKTTRILIPELLKKKQSSLAEGVVIDTCASGEDCLKVFRDYDVIVMDWNLEGMSGVETCQRIRELSNGQSPIVIILTGKHDRYEDEQVYKSGARHFLDKFDPDMLYKLLWNLRLAENHLQRRGMRSLATA